MKSNARKIEMKQRTKDTRSEALLRAHAVRDKKNSVERRRVELLTLHMLSARSTN